MRAMIATLVPLLVVAGMAAPSAQAAEPALAEILQGVEATSWTQIDYADFIGGGWNQIGQQLTFTFVQSILPMRQPRNSGWTQPLRQILMDIPR